MCTGINNTEIGFWYLISTVSKIEIPIIQRDYAQGRINAKTERIRNLFLNSLLKALDSENIELDFVYGDIKDNVFQPLDGQQRLTTLYLLHWYLAFMTEKLEENKEILKRFTYETRISSRDFCDELAECNGKMGTGDSLSEQIIDSSSFFLSWKKDPTIKSMLVMLDCIEDKLKHKNRKELENYWEKLISKKPPITFYFKQLKDIGLTDDLYIKMNARGKALTDFENFKARFEKHIKENKFEEDLLLTKYNKEQWRELTEQTFSHKIDTVWTDLFWRHRGEDNLVDNAFVKFIVGVAINSYAENHVIFESKKEDEIARRSLEEKKSKKIITNDSVKRERIERRITLLFNNPNEFTPEDFSTKDSFDDLKHCFDKYAHKEHKYDELKPDNLSFWDFLAVKKVKINSDQELENNLFLDLIKDTNTEYKQRVLFYAQTQFLLQEKTFNAESFSIWMRVIRNIVQNSTIDSASSFIGAIGLVKELSLGCADIYKFLSEHSFKSGFAAEQMKEEIIKASLISGKSRNKNENIDAIFKAEDNLFCKGKIDFALYCCTFNIADKPSILTFDNVILNKVVKVFSEHLCVNDVTNDFRRAFLTIRNNDFYDYWGSWLYAVGAPKRRLIADVSNLKNFFALRGKKNDNIRNNNWDYLKELILKLSENEIETLIEKYIDTEEYKNLANWKKKIIKEKDLLDYSEQHYIAINEDNSCCWLIPQSKVANSIEGKNKCKKIK